MKNLILIILSFSIINLIIAQEIDLSDKWIDSIDATSGFKKFDNKRFDSLDFSKALSNQLRFENDPISTYIGIFGPNNRRIDFHLDVSKNESKYLVTGKSKLGENVRELKGELKLKKVLLRKQDYITDSLFIGLFEFELNEPGDRDGDGVFSGIFTLVFYLENNEITFFKTSSGDEPNFTNTFVGKWKRNNSTVERKVIFSFHAAGLYEGLPYCEELYTFEENDDYLIIKDEFKQFGWSNYPLIRGQKTDWRKK
jgi:hypothetical protein